MLSDQRTFPTASRHSPTIVPAFTPRRNLQVKLLINQKEAEYDDGLSVKDLLGKLNLDGKPVAIEVNEDLVPVEQHSQVSLKDGDRLEIVTLAGGG